MNLCLYSTNECNFLRINSNYIPTDTGNLAGVISFRNLAAKKLRMTKGASILTIPYFIPRFFLMVS